MTELVSKPPKPKDDKSSDVDAEVSKLKSKPPPRLQKKNMVLCLPINIVVLLVTLDQIVLC